MNAFFEKYKALAIEEYLRTGVLPSIKLAQAAVESNYGKSELSKIANNFFGIKKGVGWNGEVVLADDDAQNEQFRKYNSVLESFKDHSNFLKANKRYALLFDDTNYTNWANELKQYGYATNTNYPNLLISIIEQNGLQSIDELAFKKKETIKLQQL